MRVVYNSWLAFIVLITTLSSPSLARQCEGIFQYKTMLVIQAAPALINNSAQRMLENISRPGTAPGTVIASPSQIAPNPDYYYHWIRDAALTMTELQRHIVAFSQVTQNSLEQIMFDYVHLSTRQQSQPNRSQGLGEPKFNVDGTPFTGDWGRPQNDGPALRAIAVIRFAHDLIGRGKIDVVREQLFDGHFPSTSLIKRDLEYVANHWQDSNFDLWEEVDGQHFYTLMAQQRALLDGAQLADDLNDSFAADFYRTKAGAIAAVLPSFWDASRGYLVATRNRRNGGDRASGLDVAEILAALHSGQDGEPFGVTDDRILATAHYLRLQFAQVYGINHRADQPTTAIGRYPEDTYDGYRTDSRGNPWFLATNAYAELYYRASRQFQSQKVIHVTADNAPFFEALSALHGQKLVLGQSLYPKDLTFQLIVQGLVAEGDRFIAVTVQHMDQDGHLSEQFNRDSGYMQGAQDLTWSYASLISALAARP
jgi:glucoamylase